MTQFTAKFAPSKALSIFVISVLCALIFVSVYLALPAKAGSVSCPVTDGGAGDGDSTVNGTIQISANTTWTMSGGASGDYWDCTGVDIHVTSSSTLTLAGDTASGAYPYIKTDSFTIDSGSAVSGNGKGCRGSLAGGAPDSNGYGPDGSNICTHNTAGAGQGSTPDRGAGGGGYGGDGGDGTDWVGGDRYGNVYQPVLYGSGGGAGDQWIAAAQGGAGGGVIRIEASGTFTLNGDVTANGVASSSGGDDRSGGGGSGGAIYIDTATISGSTGSIEAHGGAGGLGSSKDGGGGGGGRIHVAYTSTSSYSLSDSDYTTTAGAGGDQSDAGSVGVLVIEDKNTSTATMYGDFGFNSASATAASSVNNWTFDSSATNYCDSDATTFSFVPSGTLNYDGDWTCTADLSSGGTIGGGTNFNMGSGLTLTFSGDTTDVDFDFPSSSTETWTNITLTGQEESIFTIDDSVDLTFANVDITGNVQFTGLGGFSMDSSSSITADALGCQSLSSSQNGRGPDGSNVCTLDTAGYSTASTRSGGAGHGGAGGDSSGAISGGTTYGSSTAPVLFGSSAGGTTTGVNEFGGHGGGLIQITGAGNATLNGPISADGGAGTIGSSGRASGGGSGGSIYINFSGTISGSTGAFTANGGDGGNNGSGDGGGGGGGRVSVVYGTDSTSFLSGLSAASVAAGGSGPDSATDGANGSWNLEALTCPATDGGAGDDDGSADGTITINSNATWTMPSGSAGDTWDCSGLDLHVTNSSTLTFEGDTASGAYPYLIIDNITIDSGSTISGDGEGCSTSASAHGYGPNASNVCTVSTAGAGVGQTGGSSSGGAGGGGHGRIGGDGDTLSGGSAYGTLSNSFSVPITAFFGSSGGSYRANVAGAGGGVVRLELTGTLTNNGEISADGTAGGGAGNGGGGGSGGSIYVYTTTVTGSGTYTATGGDGGDGTNASGNGGGGGGGIVTIIYDTDSTSLASSDFTVTGGAGPDGAEAGLAGQVYLQDEDGTAWTLFGWEIEDEDYSYAGTVTTGSSSTHQCADDVTTPSITATNLTIGGTVDCTASSSLTDFDFSASTSFAFASSASVDWSVDGADMDITIPDDQTWTGVTITGSEQGFFTISDAVDIVFASGTAVDANVDWQGVVDVNIASGTRIRANSLGCSTTTSAAGSGPNGSNVCTDSTAGYGEGDSGVGVHKGTGGGGYGGSGGDGDGASGAAKSGGATYGTDGSPNQLGSSGGNSRTNVYGGKGGGMIYIVGTGTFTHNGELSADGGDGGGLTVTNANATGGGSGGTIFVETDAFAGSSGTLSADGGNGGNETNADGGGGGGGRVAIRYATNSSSHLTSFTAGGVAAGGTADTTTHDATNGSTGTLSIASTSGPVMTAAATADNDADGQIDRIVVTFDKDIDNGTVSGSDFTLSDSYSVASASRTADSEVTIVVTESGSDDTEVTPTVTIVSGIDDLSANTTSSGEQASTDGAAPVVKSAAYKDTSANGQVDRVDLTFSENIAFDECEAGDYSFGGTDAGSIAVSGCAASGDDLQLTLSNTPSNDTNIDITISYTAANGTASSVDDAAGNAVADISGQATTDSAGPQLRTDGSNAPRYQDNDADGNIDRVQLVFTESVTITYSDGDWTATANSLTSFDVSGVTTNGAATIVLTAGADGGMTGVNGGTEPTLAFTASSGSIADGNSNTLASFSAETVNDAAAPALVQATINDTDTDGLIDRLVLFWSENLDTDDSVAPVLADFGTITLPDGQTVSSATISDPGGASQEVTFSNISDQSTPNTATGSFAIAGITNEWTDGTNATSDPDGNIQIVDGAKPVFVSAEYVEVGDPDGTIDRVDVTFSENVTLDSYNTSDWSFPAAGDMSLDDTNAVASGTDIRITVSADALTTGSATTPTVLYTNNANRLNDGTNNTSTFAAGEDVDDGAGPAIRTDGSNAPFYLDNDNNGAIDRVQLTFTETVTVVYSDGDWTATANDLTSFDVGSYVSGNGTTQVILGASAAANLTGVSGGTEPTLAFSASGGSITDGAGATISSFSAKTVNDGAAPLDINYSYKDTGTPDGRVDRIDITFTEAIAYDECETGDFSVGGGDAGSIAVASCGTSGEDLQLTISNAPASDTNLALEISYDATAGTADSVDDGTPGNAAPSFSDITVADGTNPAVVSITYVEAGTADGDVDRLDVVFSEDIIVDECDAADYSFAGADGGSLSVSGCSASDETLSLTLDGTPSNDTSLTFTWAYTQANGTANSLHDLAGNNVADYGAASASDGAAPFLRTDGSNAPTYLDNNADGQVDRVQLVFTENIDLTYADANWTIVTNGVGNLDVTGITSGGDGTTPTLVLTATADANDTGGNTEPTIAFSHASNLSDGTNALASFGATDFIDGALPQYVSQAYKDTNLNGQVNRVDVTFTEPMTVDECEATDFTFGGADAGTIGVTGCATNTNDVRLTIENAPANDTALTLTLAYDASNSTANSLNDGSNNLGDLSATAISDAAAPVIADITYSDENSDGDIDQMIVTWSENVDTDDGSAPVLADFGTITLPDGQTASSASITDPAGSSDTVTLSSIVGQTTENTGAGSIAIEGITDEWTDGTNQTSDPDGSVTFTDNADPILLTSGANAPKYGASAGQVNTTTLVFSEAVTVTYSDGDWTATANNLTSYDVSGVDSGNGTSTVVLSSSAASNLTGVSGGTEPTLAFSASGGSIADGTGNTLASFSAQSLTDNAAPAIVSTSPEDGDTGVLKEADVVITFTEAIDTANDAYSWSAGDAPSGISEVWSNADKTLTISHSGDFSSLNSITFTMTAAPDADGNALSGGIGGVTHPFTFTVEEWSPGPEMTGAITADSDGDGQIDQIIVTFDVDVASGSIAGSDFTLSDSYSVTSASRTADSQVTIVVTESGSSDTDATPTVTIAGAVDDLSANSTTEGEQASTDGAAPALITATYIETGAADGQVDRLDIVFSENIAYDECEAGDYSFSGTDAGSIAVSGCATSTTTLQLTLSNTPANDTNLDMTFSYDASAGTASSLDDSTGNTVEDVTDQVLTDGAAPQYVSQAYKDTNLNGQVNRVDVTFSEPMTVDDCEASDYTFGGADAGTIAVTTCTPNGNDVRFGLENAPANDTALTLTLAYDASNSTANSLNDGSNNLEDLTATAIADAAAPVIADITYSDENSDGDIDQMIVTWSENVDTDDGSAPVLADFGTITLPDGQTASSASITDPAGSSDTVTLSSIVGQTTENTGAGSIAIEGITDEWTDGTNQTSDPDGSVTFTDNADPILLTSGANAPKYGASAGQVDTTTLVFSEAVTVTYSDGDWSATANNLTSYDVSGVDSGNGTSTVVLSSSAASNLTGVSGGTEPTLAFSASGGSIADGTGNTLASFSAQSLVDDADPAIVSIAPADGDTDIAVDADVVVTFTEGINTGSIAYSWGAGDEPTGISNGWTVSNSVLTISHSGDFATGEDITFTVTAAPDASGNTLSGAIGGVTHPVTFTIVAPPPSMISAATNDNDGDGQIDQIIVTFDKDLTGGSIAGSDFTLSDSYAVASASRTADSVVTIIVTESGSSDTDATPTVTIAGSIDATDGGNATSGEQAATDGADPVFLTSGANAPRYLDNNADGTIDRVQLVFSEAVTISYSDGDWTATANGLTGFDVSGVTTNGASTIVLTASANSSTTGVNGGTEPTLAFTASSGSIEDSASNAIASIGATSLTDAAAPALTGATISDENSDGDIDQIVTTWSEYIDTDDGSAPVLADFGTITLPDGESVSSATISDPAGASNTVTLTSVVGQTTENTAVGSFAIAGISNEWTDGSTATSDPDENISVTDAALPLMLSATYKDVVSVNAMVDRVDVTFSEPITVSTCEATDYTFGGADAGSITVTSCTADGNDVQFEVSNAPANDTNLTLTLSYDQDNETNDSLSDASGNDVEDVTDLSIIDGAAPFLRTDGSNGPQYEDNDADGQVDRVRLTFTEAVAITYDDGDWSATANDLTSFDVSGVSSGNGTATIYLTATAAAGLTGVGEDTEPTLAFTATTGSISDGSATLASFTATDVSDAAAPAPSAQRYLDTDDDGAIDRVDITFTETIDYDECEGSDFSFGGADAGSLAVDSCAKSGSDLQLAVTGGAANDTNLTVTLSYDASANTADSLDDNGSNGVQDFTETLADAAAPVRVSQSYKDVNSDGTIDRLDVTFSESIAIDECEVSDYAFAGADAGSIAVEAAGCTASGADLQLTLENTPSLDTNITITLAYDASNSTASSLDDAAGNAVEDMGASAVSDAAAPKLRTDGGNAPAYTDADSDGTVDRAILVFTEAVTVTYADGDWTATPNDLTDFDTTGYTSGNGSEIIYLAATAQTGLTGVGGGTEPDLAFSATSGSIVDGSANVLTSFSSNMLSDQADAVVITQVYKDINGDGQVDRFDVSFSEVITLGECEAGDYTIGGADAGSIAVSSCATSGSDLRLTLSNAPTNDTNLTLTFAYDQSAGTADSIEDVGGRAVEDLDAASLSDAAAPIATSYSYLDTNTDGTVDRLDVSFTEDIAYDECEAGDYSFGGADAGSIAVSACAASDADLQLTLSNATSQDTSLTLEFSYAQGTGVTNSLDDAAGNAVTSIADEGVSDAAAPVAVSAEYLDTNTDGTVDRVDVTFTESVTLDSYDASDWSFPEASELTLSDTGASASGSEIQLTVSADSNETGHDTIPTVTYTNNANRLNDGTNNTATFGSAVSITDSAAPKLRTDGSNAARYQDNNGDGQIDRVQLVFTEDITLTYDDADWTAVANNLTSFDVSGVTSGGDDSTETLVLTATAASNLTGVNGATEPTLAFADASNLTDGTNALTSFGAVSLVDAASPVSRTDGSNAIVYNDLDNDGTIDRVGLTFTEYVTVTYADGDWSATANDLTTFDVSGLSAGGDGSTASVNLTASAQSNLTGVSGGTEPSLAFTATTGSIVDGTGNGVSSISDRSLLDLAVPFIRTDGSNAPKYQDTNSDGQIDAVLLTFTENTTVTYDDSDWTATANDLTSFDVSALASGGDGSGTTATFTATAQSNLTGVSGGTEPTLAYSSVGGVFGDGGGNNSGSQSAVTVTDGAAPVGLSAEYLDTNTNGTVDRVDITFTENVTLSGYSAGDWSFPEGSELNLNDTTASSSGNKIQMTVSADSNETGHSTTPTVYYLNTAGRLTDGTNATGTFGSAINVSDSAAPMVISTTPDNGDEDVAWTDDIVMTFTESMNTESFAYTLTGTGASITDTWSSSDTVLTLSQTSGWGSGADITVTITAGPDTVANSFGGMISSANPFTFTAVFAGEPSPDPITYGTYYTLQVTDGNGTVLTQVEPGQSVTIQWTENGFVNATDLYYQLGTSASWNYIANTTNDQYNWSIPDTSATSMTLRAVNSDNASFYRTASLTLPEPEVPEETPEVVGDPDEEPEESVEETDTTDTTSDGPLETLVKSNEGSEVYALFPDGTRRVFINATTYFTWEQSFEAIDEVEAENIRDYRLIGVMLPRNGIVLVKIQSIDRVYFLAENPDDPFKPILRWIPDESIAKFLFGPDWADYVIDIEPTFFTKFGMSPQELTLDDILLIDLPGMRKRTELAQPPRQ